jgi:hypothetical protein
MKRLDLMHNQPKGRTKEKKGIPHKKRRIQKMEVMAATFVAEVSVPNFYGRIPNSVLLNISAHGTEKMFLKNIMVKLHDNAYQMLEYFTSTQSKRTNSNGVIRNTGK